MTIEGKPVELIKITENKAKGFIDWIDRNEKRLTLFFYAINAITNIVSIILLVKALKN